MDAMVAVLGAVAGILAIVALVFAVLWRRARRAVRSDGSDRGSVDRERLDLELTLAEQTNRLRVVRELHELVVNSVSTLISHADGARYTASQDPAAAARSAAVIADSARTTLADLRRVMALAREGEAVAGPHPGLASLGELVTAMNDAGLVVDLRETGDRFPLKQGPELAVYRIIQEALGNALTHGGEGTEVIVTLSWHGDGLDVAVSDDGIRATARREGRETEETTADDELTALTRPPVGRGITEMRERTELYGGVFSVTATPGVGVTVSAVFPDLRDHNGIDGVRLGAE